MNALAEFSTCFAKAMKSVDSRRPVALNARTGAPFSPGIGPHTERTTIQLVVAELEKQNLIPGVIRLEVPYPNNPRNKCDICIGTNFAWDLAVEVKMLRLMGDNGRPNDNMLLHILSPYPEHRSALTDCTKLIDSGFSGSKAILIYGYEYPGWPMTPAIESFEALENQYVALKKRNHTDIKELVHPVHSHGAVFSWEISTK